jgi:hypothetical protein
MSPTNKSYVSIQLPLGGHSFSGAELEKIDLEVAFAWNENAFASTSAAAVEVVPQGLMPT